MKGSPGEMPIPREHNMILTGLGNQNLVVFSQTPVTVKQGICCSCNENCIILLVYDHYYHVITVKITLY